MERRQTGFTLLEALTVMAIMVTVVTLGVPMFSETMLKLRTATASHLLTASLSIARSNAIMRRVPVSVCPAAGRRCRNDGVWEQGWLVFVDAERAGQPQSDADILRIADPLHDSLLLRTSPGRIRARYQPDGKTSGSTITLSLCAAKDASVLAQVIANNHGRSRTVRDPAPGARCGGT